MARRRYVPKTYNNRRILRIITTGVITVALFFVILFLILFFYFQNFVVDGQLLIPWLTDEPTTVEGDDGEGGVENGTDEGELLPTDYNDEPGLIPDYAPPFEEIH